jgi:hypothetical protein
MKSNALTKVKFNNFNAALTVAITVNKSPNTLLKH